MKQPSVILWMVSVALCCAGCTASLTVDENDAGSHVDSGVDRGVDDPDTHAPDIGADVARPVDGDPDAGVEVQPTAGTVTFELSNRTARSVTAFRNPAGFPCSNTRGWLGLSVDGAQIQTEATCTQCRCAAAECAQCDLLCDETEVTTLHAGQSKVYAWDKRVWSYVEEAACITPRLAVGEEVTAEFCWGDEPDPGSTVEPIIGHQCVTRTVVLTEDDQHVEVVLDAGQDDWDDGDEFFGANNWLEVHVGDMPLVISAPHGGMLDPSSIPDRSCSGITTVTDSRTVDLAFAIEQRVQSVTGESPYMIVAHIRRRKIDLNRDVQQATCGNARMITLWEEYHEQIERALARAIERHGYAIYIDLHGHGHTKQRLELGYAITGANLRAIDNDPDEAARFGPRSSLANLLAMSDLQFLDMLTGDEAFGTLAHAAGAPSVPSKQDPAPLSGDAYFNGGYNTGRYTGPLYSRVFGWQIETNNGFRTAGSDGGAAARQTLARAFTTAYGQYRAHVESHMNY